MRFQKWAASVGCPDRAATYFDADGFLPNLLSFAAQRGSRQVALYALAHGCAWNGIAYYDGEWEHFLASLRSAGIIDDARHELWLKFEPIEVEV